MFARYIALCTGYIRFDTFHIARYIALCTGYIRLDTFHIVGCIVLCTGYMDKWILRKRKKKRGNFIGHLGWHLEKTKSLMHALTLKFSRRVGGLMLHTYLNPILLSFQKEEKRKKKKEQEQKIRRGKIITSKRKIFIYFIFGGLWEFN
ncbi:hypothetical protein H5410_050009 [Solanum commersonii]|uniref:Uncharacterized protein n=1 Tax=Solanum commersonii TaxID=4109 RepID=A0A9J5WWQ8_SOLCO|nr:hypothetical protein H5410_050009 [Solanum commersonii]